MAFSPFLFVLKLTATYLLLWMRMYTYNATYMQNQFVDLCNDIGSPSFEDLILAFYVLLHNVLLVTLLQKNAS